MESTDGYRAFLAVLDAGSIAAAARRLGIPRPTVTRRLTQLESGLGVRLVHRGRTAQPTREGVDLARRVRPILRDLADAEGAVRRSDAEPRGRLRVSMSPGVVRALQDVLLDYQAAHPLVVLDVVATNRYVDLRAEQFDLAIRGGVLRDPDLIARRLATSRALAVASPDLVAREALDVDALKTRGGLVASLASDGLGRWPLWGGGMLSLPATLVTDDRDLLVAAALAGRGVALVSGLEVQEHLRTGALVPVVPQVGARIGFFAVHTERAYLAPRVRLLVDALLERFPREN